MASRPSLGLAPLEADGKQGARLWAGHGFFVGEGGGMPSAVAQPLPQLAVPLAAAPGATCSVRTPAVPAWAMAWVLPTSAQEAVPLIMLFHLQCFSC